MGKITRKSSGGGYRLSKILNKDVKELNGIILSLLCISFLLVVGLISYKVNSSYAIFTDTIEGEKTIEISVNLNLDSCNPNVPVLSENMIAVYYDETCNNNEGCWKKADSENKNPKYKWYDYCDKMWANSVTVTNVNRSTYLSADLGTEIPMEDILTMQVWIPRYKYKLWNYNLDGTVVSEPQEIRIEFENGKISTGEISCNDAISGTDGAVSETCEIKATNAACTDDACNGKTYTHPAFTFGTEELAGFWVGKFEVSSDLTCTATTYSNIGSGCNLTTIKPLVKPGVTSWRAAMVGVFENNMMSMNDTDNKYGFAETDDTHMMKNSEWGAVAYLSHSKYGKYGNDLYSGNNKEIYQNKSSSYLTGNSNGTPSASTTNTQCLYNNIIDRGNGTGSCGGGASTTGNIYGIYDMSGGAYEYVMGNLVSNDGKTMMSGNQSSNYRYSGFTGIVYNGTSYSSITGKYNYPEDQYYDKYSFNAASINKKLSKLGDGIREVATDSNYSWYGDFGYVVFYTNHWFMRGAIYEDETGAGVFSSARSGGHAAASQSARVVINVPS